jgi:hypothetical protein
MIGFFAGASTGRAKSDQPVNLDEDGDHEP